MRRLVVALSVLGALLFSMPGLVIAQDLATPEAGAGARTDVRYLLPYGPDGLNANLTEVGTEAGTCHAESLAAPNRPDAHDCLGESNQIYDPCFESPYATVDSPVDLACMASPFTSDVTLLTVNSPLERVQEEPADQDLFPGWDLPWALELANGDQCVLLGTVGTALAGESVYYGCTDGGTILGEVNRSQPVWTVNYLADGAVSSGLVEVAVAWS